MNRAICILAAAAAALAACGKKPAAGGAAAPESEKAGPATAAAPPSAMPNPVRKPGLWRHTISFAGRKQAMTICFDESMAREMAVMGQEGAAEQKCRQRSLTPMVGGWKFSSTCPAAGGGVTVANGEVRGDFNSRIDMTMQLSTTGSSMPQANGAHAMTMTAEWVGPCPAGSRAGDMTLPGGMKINMLAARQAGAGRPGG